MIKIKTFLWLFCFSFSIIIFTGCSNNPSNNEVENAQDSKTEINTELLIEQNAVYEKVCKDFSEINQMVVELNKKIRSMEGKLTAEQNNAIDEIEAKRSSINNRMRGLKAVSSDDWEDFKTTLGKDLVDVKSQVEEIIGTIN